MAKVAAARKRIEDAIKATTLKTARFGMNDAHDIIIKRDTHLYRMTWIIPPLMQALKDLDPCDVCDPVTHTIKIGRATAKCLHCDGTGIRGGLNFDPYQWAESVGRVDE